MVRKGTYLSLGGNNLALSDTLALSSHGKRLLELLAEDDVFDKHALDLDTPAGSNVLDDLSNALGDLLAALNDILEHTGTDDVAEGGLGALDEGLADVGNAEGGLVGGDDVVVDDRGQVEGDVVLGHADLLGNLDNLDLDVHLDQVLAEGVDLDEAGVDGLVELAELGDQANVTLCNSLVRVGAADATGEGTHCSDARAKGVDCGEQERSVYDIHVVLLLCEGTPVGRPTHAAIPALGVGIVADDAGIALLQVFWFGRLDRHVGLRAKTGGDGGVVLLALGRARVAVGRVHGCGGSVVLIVILK